MEPSWELLAKSIMALTPIVVPLLVALLKGQIPKIPTPLIPLIAIATGGVIDVVAVYAIDGGLGGPWGLVLGAVGVAVREVFDQFRKALKTYEASKPTKVSSLTPIVVLMLVPALLAGCARLGQQAPPDTIAYLADSLNVIGQRGLNLNKQYVVGCAAKTIPRESCQQWKNFYEGEFKPTWIHVEDAFSAAAAAGDLTTAQAKVRLVEKLAESFSNYLLMR